MVLKEQFVEQMVPRPVCDKVSSHITHMGGSSGRTGKLKPMYRFRVNGNPPLASTNFVDMGEEGEALEVPYDLSRHLYKFLDLPLVIDR